MRFVLEESSWHWEGTDRDGYIERIEQLLDRLDVADGRNEPFAANTDLQHQKVYGEWSLVDLLWQDSSPLALPWEVRERLAARLAVMQWWDENGEAWPAVFEVEIGGQPRFSPGAALCCERVRSGRATACLALPGGFSGPCAVRAGTAQAQVHFVTDEKTHRAFFRDALDVERADERRLQELAPHAFPDIWFIDEVWRGLRDFKGGYVRARDNLLRLLVALDDHGAWIFTDTTGRLSPDESAPAGRKVPITNQLIEQRFVGWGLRVAPEKPNVREDKRCREARERTLGRRIIYCEWHCKLEGQTNRVHFHGPVVESGHKVIVAILAEHLPLPGG